jgi:hypothetical protein
MRIETGIPFEGPKLLNTHLTNRPVQKEAVDEAPVTRDAERPDAVAANDWVRGGFCLGRRRAVGWHWVPRPQGAVQHDWGFGNALHIDARPSFLNAQLPTQELAAVVSRGVGVEAVAARTVGMVGTIPGQERAAGPVGAGLASGHRTELLEVEVVEVIGELLGSAAVPGIPVAELALIALSEGVEQETPLVQVRLTDCGFRLRADQLQRRQQDRQKQSNNSNYQQQLNQSECSLSAHRFCPMNAARINKSMLSIVCFDVKCLLYTFSVTLILFYAELQSSGAMKKVVPDWYLRYDKQKMTL